MRKPCLMLFSPRSLFPVSCAPRMVAELCNSRWGIFEGRGDVGVVLHAGSVDYDPAKGTYTISGSGENMWLAADAFQFAWKKVSGDVSLTSGYISFLTKTGNEHKKAVLSLMLRKQSLDADAVYADVALHASGLTSLQFRDEKGALTREVQSNLSAPRRLRIAKRGDYVYMSLSNDGEPKPAGGMAAHSVAGDVLRGARRVLARQGCCGAGSLLESRVDRDHSGRSREGGAVQYTPGEPSADPRKSARDRRVAYLAPGRFEAPNWTRDGNAFLFNRDGHIEHLVVGDDKPVIIDTGFANRCNNDHGISPDSTELAISDNSQGDHGSRVYLVPFAGGAPRRITEASPSYWHGWSPDGKTLAFVGQRNGDFDIYTIPAAGGNEETRLTTARVWMTVRNIRRMENIFTSIPSAPGTCRSGA